VSTLVGMPRGNDSEAYHGLPPRHCGMVFALPTLYRDSRDSYTAFSQWKVDGSYGSAAVHQDDSNALEGLAQNSRDFHQTQAGRCIASEDPRLAK
jgi:hypothetical protein